MRTKLTRRTKVLLIAVLLLGVVIAGVFFGLRYAVYYPSVIVSGENTCWIGRYNLSKDGFARLQEIVDRSQGMPQNANVAFFEAYVDKKGCVIGFTLSLDTFDEKGVYLGLVNYRYSDRKLSYNPPTLDNLSLVRQENPNGTLDYLGEQIKKIPFSEQIEKSGLSQYAIRYQPYTMLEKDTPVFDERSGAPFAVLGPEDYNAGGGGFSDGETNVVFLLYDGQSMVDGQMYWYVFEPVEPALAVGNPEVFMECDYYISNGRLQFRRNYGQDVIDADITADELSETMDFYRNGPYLPPESLFISADVALPIAYFYGAAPMLKISADNGSTWSAVPFPSAKEFGRSVTKRAVGFVTPQFGYVALGTDWSMGGGENKRCYFTFDGGESWTDKALPLAGTSRTLSDFAMADEENGVVALNEGMEGNFPLLYGTTDTGDTWEEIRLPYEALPREVQYLTYIDSLVYENGKFVLTLGQGDSGTIKAVFTAADINSTWEYVEAHNATIHSIG
jgi:hypothetical protein